MKNLFLILTTFFSIFSFAQKEVLNIPFPEKYDLVIKQNEENNKIIFKEWIPKKETFDNYTIIATEMTIKDMAKFPLDNFKQTILDSFNERAIGAKFTEIVRELNYIIFKSEVDYYKNAPQEKEAQLYFITKGKNDLYSVSIAIKEKKLSDKFIKEWTEVFKNIKIVEKK